MFQLKRILLFIPFCVLAPALCVAVLTEVLRRYGIYVDNTLYVVSVNIGSNCALFLVFWVMAKGIASKPYQHSFIVYIASTIISIGIISLAVRKLLIPPTIFFDIPISIVVLLVATKLGYGNKDVSSNVS